MNPTTTNNTRYLVIALSVLTASSTLASGIYRNGISARGMSLAGAESADTKSSLEAIGMNPAGLANLKSIDANVGLIGGFADAEFRNRANLDASMRSTGFIPEAALGLPLCDGKFALGIGVVPEAFSSADWTYIDTPGGANGTTTFGRQTHKSEILVLRSSIGAAMNINEHIAIGASIGMLYNENTLQAPYIFQNHPKLKGIKTLLDLNTAGYGVDGQVGLLIKPNDKVNFSLTYKTPSEVVSEGHAKGDANAQFAALGIAAPSTFHYDAEVENHFPQIVSAGALWKIHPRFRTVAGIDWVNWSDAFDNLKVHLENGNNATINTVAGSRTVDDSVPLEWRDSFVYRVGFEFDATTNLTFRTGYCYGRNPAANENLTPLTAAISEHTVAAGLGYSFSRYQIDLGYQWDIPNTERVGVSGLRAGEYSNSSVRLSSHWFGLTATAKF